MATVPVHRIQTSLVGMQTVVKQLESCLDNPPHIFLVGFPGTGKSTLANDFLKAYFKHHNISKKEEKEYSVEIPSHQDRGIHTFRQILNDHVRWIAPKKGIYRWISLMIVTHYLQFLSRPYEDLWRHLTILHDLYLLVKTKRL
jgi:DNA polymerase III delta prime subunit